MANGRELFPQRVELVNRALEFFKFLPSFGELSFCCQSLIVSEILGGFRDEPVISPTGWCAAVFWGAALGASAAVREEVAPPKREVSAASKVGPYARRS